MPRFDPLPDRRPALVAGASSGIGAATAIDLAARGFPVALGARRVEKCQELVEAIRGDGGEAIAVIDCDSPEPDFFDQEDRKGLEALAGILSQRI